ncbi:hypothetical protein DXG01_011341, partial [Tephrocybe rancida]
DGPSVSSIENAFIMNEFFSFIPLDQQHQFSENQLRTIRDAQGTFNFMTGSPAEFYKGPCFHSLISACPGWDHLLLIFASLVDARCLKLAEYYPPGPVDINFVMSTLNDAVRVLMDDEMLRDYHDDCILQGFNSRYTGPEEYAYFYTSMEVDTLSGEVDMLVHTYLGSVVSPAPVMAGFLIFIVSEARDSTINITVDAISFGLANIRQQQNLTTNYLYNQLCDHITANMASGASNLDTFRGLLDRQFRSCDLTGPLFVHAMYYMGLSGSTSFIVDTQLACSGYRDPNKPPYDVYPKNPYDLAAKRRDPPEATTIVPREVIVNIIAMLDFVAVKHIQPCAQERIADLFATHRSASNIVKNVEPLWLSGSAREITWWRTLPNLPILNRDNQPLPITSADYVWEDVQIKPNELPQGED